MGIIYLLERIDFNKGFPEKTLRGPEQKPLDPYLFVSVHYATLTDRGTKNLEMRDTLKLGNSLTEWEIGMLKNFQNRNKKNSIVSSERIFNLFEIGRFHEIQGACEFYRRLQEDSAEARRLDAAGIKVYF